MVCKKCGYKDNREVEKMGMSFCRICAVFVPEDKIKFDRYVSERVDWRSIDSFRRLGQLPGFRQKKGMQKRAMSGALVTRAPLGYDVKEGKLVPNIDSSKVHSLFKTFLDKDLSLNTISKDYGLSVNGLKKVLKNRTYLGEIKFDGQLHKANHKTLISPEVFYAVQRKLQKYLRPRGREANKYVLNKTVEPFREKSVNVVERPTVKEIDGLGGLDKGDGVDEVDEVEEKNVEKEDGLYKSIFDE